MINILYYSQYLDAHLNLSSYKSISNYRTFIVRQPGGVPGLDLPPSLDRTITSMHMKDFFL